jgi:hypothetical protein
MSAHLARRRAIQSGFKDRRDDLAKESGKSGPGAVIANAVADKFESDRSAPDGR